MRTRTRPSRPAQLRTRVVAGVLAVTLVALATFALTAITALRGYLLTQTRLHLQTVLSMYRPVKVVLPQAQRAAGAASPGGAAARAFRGPLTQLRPSAARAVLTVPPRKWVIAGPHALLPGGLSPYYVEWVSAYGPEMFIRGNPDLVPRITADLPALAARRREWTVVSMNGHAQLMVTARPADQGTLIASTSLESVNRTVDQLALIVAVGSAIAGTLIAVGVAWIMRRGLRPIETMASQADRITAGDLTERVVPHDAGTEVGRLGAALNGMLARIEASVHEREASQELTRRFFADASHELRTPLASLRANAELYQQGALAERSQVDEAMRRIALEAQRMSRLVDDMLRLARLDQRPGQQDDVVDVTALVRSCAERAEIADPSRRWRTDVAPDLAVIGDEELLRRAVDNLLANVGAHTPEGTIASVSAARRGGAVVVEVSDDGPGVPADALIRVFERFYRCAAPSHRPGSGLGLAIVKAIAEGHGGAAEASLNSPHGLRVALTLPATAG